jgi:transcriptional regulator with XRE-family HTH domain
MSERVLDRFMLREMSNRTAGALGEIIRQQRELADISMRQFAELAGISNPYLSQIERGLRAPSEHVLDGIANALQVSTDVLYQQAGMSPPGEEPESSEVLDAIASDSRLSARQRTALREVYEAFVASSLGSRPRTAPGAHTEPGVGPEQGVGPEPGVEPPGGGPEPEL